MRGLKFFELRDQGTFIPVFAFQCKPDDSRRNIAENYLLRRSGFHSSDNGSVILGKIDAAGISRNCSYDPYAWGDRTFTTAHDYIAKNFDELQSGQVIDVEVILGEKVEPKVSERLCVQTWLDSRHPNSLFFRG